MQVLAPIQRQQGGSAPEVQCPECRKVLPLPPGGVGALPCNYSLLHMAAVLERENEKAKHELQRLAPAVAAAAPVPGIAPANIAATAITEITLKWTYGAVGAKAKKRKIKLRSGDSYAQVQAAIEGKNGEGKVLVEYDDADGDQYEMDDEDSWREVLALAMGRDGRVLEVHVS